MKRAGTVIKMAGTDVMKRAGTVQYSNSGEDGSDVVASQKFARLPHAAISVLRLVQLQRRELSVVVLYQLVVTVTVTVLHCDLCFTASVSASTSSSPLYRAVAAAAVAW